MPESLHDVKQSIIIAMKEVEAQRKPLNVTTVQQVAARGFQGEHQVPLNPSDFNAALSELADEEVLAVEPTSPTTIRYIKR